MAVLPLLWAAACGASSAPAPAATPAVVLRQAAPAVEPTQAAPTASSSYHVAVTRGGQELARLSLADLLALPQVKLMADGKEQAGPTLRAVLDAAGVREYSAVTIVGKVRQRVATGELRIAADEVTDRVVLDINRRGETKLASPDIPPERWIVDVAELRVE